MLRNFSVFAGRIGALERYGGILWPEVGSGMALQWAGHKEICWLSENWNLERDGVRWKDGIGSKGGRFDASFQFPSHHHPPIATGDPPPPGIFHSFSTDARHSPKKSNEKPKMEPHSKKNDHGNLKSDQENGSRGLGGNREDDVTVWLMSEMMKMPNMLSLSRMVAGPVIGYLIVSDMWAPAIAGLGIAGMTDWLDGYLAKRQGQQSVLGSYLDPLADKVLIGCTVIALVYNNSLPSWAAVTIIARDAFLVLGTAVHYARTSKTGLFSLDTLRHIQRVKKELEGGGQDSLVRPLFISKVNTVVQFGLIAGCMGNGLMGWPGEDGIVGLAALTVGTTLVSWGAYGYGYFIGKRAIP